MSVTAIIPVKALDRAKGRLARELNPAARRDLVAAMLDAVLAACRESTAVRDVLVVAGDDAAAALVAPSGVEVIVEGRPGLDAALATADAATTACAATLVVAADLPLATGVDLDEVCARGAAGRAVVIAPTHDGGTAALLRRPPAVMATAFGPASAEAHARLGAEAGARVTVVHLPRLAFDVDTSTDLRLLRARHSGDERPG